MSNIEGCNSQLDCRKKGACVLSGFPFNDVVDEGDMCPGEITTVFTNKDRKLPSLDTHQNVRFDPNAPERRINPTQDE